jgi:hypothetical protein
MLNRQMDTHLGLQSISMMMKSLLIRFTLCCTGTRCPKTNPGTWGPLGNLPKLSGTPSGTWGLAGHPQDILGRFQRRLGQISGMF